MHTPTPFCPAGQNAATRFWVLLGFLWFITCGSSLYAYDLTVAQDGTGNYTTVQAAINAAPTGRTTAYTIFIKNGTYREKLSIPATKPFLQLIGESVANTILTYSDGASTVVGGVALGTQNSASFTVGAADFLAMNITFENAFGDGSQAVAVLVNADRAVFKNCRLLGNQDTLYVKGSGTPNHYFRDCYIDGNVDFIFGSSVDVFDRCVVYAKSRTSNGASYITAASTPPGQTYGFVFRDAKVPSNTGATLYYLGRPWQNSTGSSPLANNKVIWLKTKFGANQIQPVGWSIWDAGTDVTLITDAEYRSRYFDGHAVNTSQRVSWSRQLLPADTAIYQTSTIFGSWNPCNVAVGICATATPDIAVSNFRATRGTTQTTLDWNISWAMTGIRYDLYRSSDNITFSQINTLTATTDSTYNFQMTDALPAAGAAYYYQIRASKAGLATHVSPTAVVSRIATITTTGTLSPFIQYQATPSASQNYTLAGDNLTSNLTITPPASFEISTNGGTTWSTSPITLTPTANNTIAATTVSVRLNGATDGVYTGTITHTSTGATTVNIAVTGSRVAATPPQSNPLAWWPLKLNNQDSTAVRSALVTVTPAALRRLYVSNGTTVPAIPAYSPQFGQAFGATSAGDGQWGTAAGGPGGNISRLFYEQFTVTASASGPLRVDSLLATSAFYNTSSNTKLAVVYSRSNFTADSTTITGGTFLGSTLPATANGAYTTPILLANQTAGPTNQYRLALNGSAGVTLLAGQTLTLRLYFACGSSSAGRYALLKNVVVKGAAATVACNAAFAYQTATYCRTGTNPTPSITGTAGGTFTASTGLSITAATGAINLAASTAGTYTVTYTASANCSSTQSVTITAAPLANIGYSATSYCTTTTGAVAVGIGTGSTAGTFIVNPATGLTLNATTGAITPSTSTPGTYFITNTVAASGGCAAATGGTTVTIVAPATAGFSYSASSYCTTATGSVTASLGTGSTAGAFTVSPATGLTLNATTGAITPSTSTAGTYTITNTVAASGGCAAATSTSTVTIVAPATAGFSYAAASYCAGGTTSPTPTLTTGAAAGAFTSATGLSINATTGAINLATSTAGTYTVTNTIAAAGSCAAVTATATVIINPIPATPILTSTAQGSAVLLTSSAATGNQFYLNNVLVVGATGQTYLVNSGTLNGSYTVRTTSAAGCVSAASTAVSVTVLATKSALANASLRLYPNPTPGQLTLELTGYQKAATLTVLNALGQVVHSRTLSATTVAAPVALDLSALAGGVYTLRLSTPDGTLTQRLVRK